MERDFEYTNILKHRVGGGAVAGLSLLFLIAESPVLVIFGLMGGMAGLAYTLATCTLEGPIKRSEGRLEAELRTLAARQDKVKKERDRVKAELALLEAHAAKMKSDAETLKANVKTQFDTDIKAARKALAQEFRDKGDDLAADYARKVKSLEDEKLDRIKFHKARLIGDNAQLFKRCEELESLLEQRDEYLKREFNRRLESYGNAYEEMQKAIMAQGATVGEARAAFEAQYQALIDERDRLAQEVRRLRAPKRFRRSTDNDLRGNKILDFFKKKGVLLEGEDWEARFNHTDYYLYPMPNVSFEDVKKHLVDMQVSLGFITMPKLSAESGCIKLTVKVDNKPTAIEIPQTSLKRVEKTVDLANHLRIVGPSGSGKSTWLDNVIWLGINLWPQANHTILDPKYPFTEWSNIKPDFKNDECVTKIQEIGLSMAERFSEANKVADAYGADSDEFSRYLDALSYELFVIDEAQDLYRRAKKCDRTLGNRKNELANGVRDSLLECLNVGRALKVKSYFITQSAKCSKINLNEDDFDNAVSIFLGASISYALSAELKDSYSKEKLDLVKTEFSKRKEMGQQYLGLVSDLERDDLYLFELPRPGFYFERVMHSRPPSAQSPGPATKQGQTLAAQSAQPSPENRAEESSPEKSANGTIGVSSSAQKNRTETAEGHPQPLAQDLQAILKQGSHCPHCGVHSAVFKNKKPTKKGEVSVRCKTPDCESKGVFKWKVI